MINIQKKNLVSATAFDSLVTKTYGKPYNFQQQDGCKERGTFHMKVPDNAYDFENDTLPEEINGEEMGVSFAAWLARDPREWNGKPKDRSYLDMFWERNFYPDVQMIANDLHTKGLMPAGDYVLEIDW